MTLIYKTVRRKVLSGNEKGEVRYFATVKHPYTCDTDSIVERVSKQTRIHALDIKRVIRALKDVIRQELKGGGTVHVGELGYFHLTVTSTGADSPHAFTKRNITGVNLIFRPGRDLCPDKDEIEFKRAVDLDF